MGSLLSGWKDIPPYNSDKRVNKKVAMAILIAMIAQGLGLFVGLGFDLSAPIELLMGFSPMFLLQIIGSAWIAYGFHKHKF